MTGRLHSSLPDISYMVSYRPQPVLFPRTRAMMHRFHERYRHELNGGAGGGEGGGEADMRGRDPFALPIALEMQLYSDCTEAQLLEPLFADNLTAFAVLEVGVMAQ